MPLKSSRQSTSTAIFVFPSEKTNQHFEQQSQQLQRQKLADDAAMKQNENSEDALKGRLTELKQMAGTSLFEEAEILTVFLVNKMASATPDEATAFIEIVNFIKQYISSRDNYSGQVAKLTPIIAHMNLHASSIDAATLFSVFDPTTVPAKIPICDFEGYEITPEIVATSNKDIVIAHKLSVLPGMKCVRLYGTRFYRQPRQQQAARPTVQRILDDDRKLKLKEESKHLHIQLRDAKAELNDILSNNDVRQLKNNWNNATVEESERYPEVEVAKTNKRN
ncbi:hypothetical protein [Parasitella parasitica]|uniref:Uncharacterized protein n=1 Tax=Parasitella parasitica TaxID=35722 RepID=A0A0B7MUV0_9FUNG|nr:hypothetical protein [Parasitella parasitica]